MDTIAEARAARDDGIKRAVDHANAVVPSWADQAYALLRDYAMTHAGFTSEDLSAYAIGVGLPIPPDKRAWGGVVGRARRNGVVEPAGYAASKVVQAHMRTNRVWKSLLYPTV